MLDWLKTRLSPATPEGEGAEAVGRRDGASLPPSAAMRRSASAVSAASAAASTQSGHRAVASKAIESRSEVPSHTGLMRLHGAGAVHQVPELYRTQLVALDTGVKRAEVLYAPALRDKEQGKQLLQEVTTGLTARGFQFTSRPCALSVIQELLREQEMRSDGTGVERGAQGRGSSSAARLARSWIELAVKAGATDIHAQVEPGGIGRCYLRVDGELELMKDDAGGKYSDQVVQDAIASLFTNQAARGSNSEGTFNAQANLYCMTQPEDYAGSRVVLRYQTIKGDAGPKMVARLLHVSADLPTRTYVELGYADTQRELLLEAAKLPSGIGLFAGVTGSGKTTSLKTFVETHPANPPGSPTAAFYSIEDPVEYKLRGVHQIPIQRSLGEKDESRRAFLQQVEALMRADPDLVVVGEIRDEASATAAQVVAETGHMAMGTVHAHLLSGIITRLTNSEVGMSRDTLTGPNMLSLLAYQALVPKLCSACSLDWKRMSDVLSEKDRQSGGLEGMAFASSIRHLRGRYRVELDALRFRNPSGCSVCSSRGTRGQTVVAEMLIPDAQWLAFTREGRDAEAERHRRDASDRNYLSENMEGKTILEHTLFKALLGQVDVRHCERFGSFARSEVLTSPAPRLHPVAALPDGVRVGGAP